VASLWLGIIVLLPLAAVVVRASETDVWAAVTTKASLDALRLTLTSSLAVAAVNVVLGTLTAWVLVRDEFRARAASTRSSTCRSRCRRSSRA
jgi:sulfate transport system permease protein